MGHRGVDHPEHGRLDARLAVRVAEQMQALGTASRLRILGCLRDGACSVGELASAVDMEQSAVSHQLRVLRHLGWVSGTRDGRRVVYELHDDHVGQLLDEAVAHTEHLQLARGRRDHPTQLTEARA
jgi:DNA-binding transcriptional ArsR family regulator